MQPEPEFDPVPLLTALSRGGVDFVVIGGVAGGVHGSAIGTQDLDVAYAGDRDNLERLAEALRDLAAHLRGKNVPGDLPFILDATRFPGSELHLRHAVRLARHPR